MIIIFFFIYLLKIYNLYLGPWGTIRIWAEINKDKGNLLEEAIQYSGTS